MNYLNIQVLLCLKEYVGPYYPTEIVRLIMMMYHSRPKIHFGSDHSSIVVNGNVYICGRNTYGKLGICNTKRETYMSPQKLSLKNIKKVMCLAKQTIALTYSGEVYIWGDFSSYPINVSPCDTRRPSDSNMSNIKKIKYCKEFPVIFLIKDDEIYTIGREIKKHQASGTIKIKCSSRQCIVLMKNGNAYSYGPLEWIYKETSEKFFEIPLTNVIMIACGIRHLVAVTLRNKIYTWGKNNYGQLGLGDTQQRDTPCKIVFGIELNTILSISCGDDHTMLLTLQGDIYGWGLNNYGDTRYLPQKIYLENIKYISCSGNHTIFKSILNEVYVCGVNKFGQLGLGDFKNATSPTKLPFSDIIHISHKNDSMALITARNQIYVCGDNTYGQLGLNDTDKHNFPIELKFNLLS